MNENITKDNVMANSIRQKKEYIHKILTGTTQQKQKIFLLLSF
jgi:hypothetical protein